MRIGSDGALTVDGWRSPSGCIEVRIRSLGDAAGAAAEGKRCEATVAQQEHTVDEVTDVGELVRGDDRRAAALRRFAYDTWDDGCSILMRRVVDEHDAVGAGERRLDARGVRTSDQERRTAVLDRSRIRASETGEAVEQRGGACAARAENGDTFSLVHLEGRPAQHPDARRTSRDAGGVALPER